MLFREEEINLYKSLSSVIYLILFIFFTFLFLHEFLFMPFIFDFSILEYIHLEWLGFWSIFLAITFLGLFLRKAYNLNIKKILLIIGGSILLVFLILLILLLSVAGQLWKVVYDGKNMRRIHHFQISRFLEELLCLCW